jgi:PAS domain S-box-containing protein
MNEMNNATFLGLVQNVALLLAIALIFDMAALRWRTARTTPRQMLLGLILGGIGIAIMLTPWQFVPGIIFDTRSVLLGISGLFFGTVPTLVAMLITAVFRLSQGGAAAWTGVFVIAATGTIGIIWRNLRRKSLYQLSWKELYLFGLLLHVVMLALMFTLPLKTAMQVLGNISLPVLVIYPLGTMLLGVLMTSRMQRERLIDTLRENEAWLRLAVAASNIGFYDLDLVNGGEHFSPEWKRQLGYQDHEIRDDIDEWRSRIHPDDLLPALERERANIEARRPEHESEFRLRHKDGSYRWMLSRGLLQYDGRGKAVRLLGCHIDVTERKSIEATIFDSERRFRGLAEGSQDYIMLYDRDCRHVYENPAALRVSGLTAAEVIGKTHREMGMSEELSAMWEADITRVFETGAPSQRLFDWEGAQGKVFLDWRLSPVLGAGENVDLVLGISRDITTLKQAEENMRTTQVELRRLLEEAAQSRKVLLNLLEDQKRAEERIRQFNVELEQRVHERTAQLEAANQELEAFAYSVSHDLRTPLRALDGYSTILQQDYAGRLDEEGRGHLERIRLASQRMGHLIDDLLKLSRVTRTAMNLVEVDLSSLAKEVCDELSLSQPQRVVQWVLPEKLLGHADPALMRIVLQNLLGNAFKFISKHAAGRIELGSREQAGRTVYYVRDDGAGFDMRYAGRLFGAFERLHSDHEFEGTGIGLALVQRIIHRHGGRIWAESVVEQETTFYFTLETADTLP